MRTIIVDDEVSNQENLHQLLKLYAADVQVVAVAGDVSEAATAIKTHRPDMLFLDIQLHGQSGFDLLKQLDEIDFAIIFVTAYDQYGIQAIKFAALDYLLKPIDIDELTSSIEKARTRYVNVNDIVRCEADNTYTHFFLADGELVLVSKTLKEYADMLERYDFLRTHQTHLVNMTYIKSWIREDGGSLLLKDGAKIPISKINRVKVKDMLAAQFKL